jgi:hypothetical protein
MTGTRNKGGLVFALGAVLAFAASLLLIADWYAHRPQPDQRVAFGEVIEATHAYVGPLRRPLLKIRVAGEGHVVHAVLMVDSARGIPQRVSFYYPPSADGEVQLLDETSSLIGASLGACLALIATLLSMGLGRRRS